MKEAASKRHRLRSVLLWTLSLALTLACLAYQDKTGPTYPLEGELETAAGPVSFKFMRSETIGNDLALVLLDPVPDEIGGFIRFRRFKSDDEWSRAPMQRGEFELARRGSSETVGGVGVTLPSLKERAGKYEFFVYIDDGNGEAESVTGDVPIYARYKAAVPVPALIAHIIVIFASMMIAIRAVLEALINGAFKWMLWATIISLLLGGFLFGPLVQWYAFGVWWSGVPYDIDWTDNKVLVELVFWAIAAFLNRGFRRNRASVYLAGVVTLLVYFIPHSVFGSEFDYRIGSGRGTVG